MAKPGSPSNRGKGIGNSRGPQRGEGFRKPWGQSNKGKKRLLSSIKAIEDIKIHANWLQSRKLEVMPVTKTVLAQLRVGRTIRRAIEQMPAMHREMIAKVQSEIKKSNSKSPAIGLVKENNPLYAIDFIIKDKTGVRNKLHVFFHAPSETFWFALERTDEMPQGKKS